MPSATAASPSDAPSVPRPSFRTDIDGLRGVAILLVILFHAHVDGFTGGFVGVDVFFVISGYLITRQLIAEGGASGSVRLREFWAKRVRRLVPALTVMVATVLLAGLVVLSPLEWAALAKDGVASVAYVSNMVFGLRRGGYFAADDSVFLHTWSLSVEEQFYLVWPVLVLAAAVVGRRTLLRFRTVLVGGLAVMTPVSLALCVVLTERGTPLAFFALPTRMWEFGAAGLLAATSTSTRWAKLGSGARRVAPLVGLAGLGAILASTFLFDERTAYPGAPALLPVVGTLLVIGAGQVEGASPLHRLLVMRPLLWFGRVSYSWYLWHWPVILLTVAALNSDTVPVRVGASALGLALALVALRFVENPVRFSPVLRSSLWRTYALGLLGTLLVAGLAAGLVAYGHSESQQPFYRELQAATQKGADDEGRPTAGCATSGRPTVVSACVVGVPDADTTVLLLGDSHAGQWVPAFDRVGKDLGVRVVVRSRGACPALDVPIANAAGPLEVSSGCLYFRTGTAQLIAAEHPAAVILSNAGYIGRILDADGGVPSEAAQLRIWRSGFEKSVRSLTDADIGVGVILDNPWVPFDPVTCIARSGSVSSCPVAATEAFRPTAGVNRVETDVASSVGGVAVYTSGPTICGRTACSLRIGSTYVFSDKNHLTGTFTASQWKRIRALVTEALGR
ncbi:MAG: acyltransferase family protein [Acidimicrobiales bacterium]